MDDTRINQFLTASRFLQDAVFSRTADLNSVKEVTAADVFYHNKCHKEYCSKYEDEIKKVDQSGSSKSTEKRDLFLEAMKDIYPRIELGYGFPLSEIRDYIMSLSGNTRIRNT